MNHFSDDILLQCLEQFEYGHPVESILARFPEHASELRPFLEATRRLQGLAAGPAPAVQQRARAGFLAQAAVKAGAAARWTRPAVRARCLVPAMALLLLLLLVGATVVPASASAVPGDMLYGTKRAVEQWRLWLAAGPAQEAELASSFSQERLREILKLLATGRNAEVSFTGTIESAAEQQWTVGGLPVVVNSTTVIIGRPWLGMEARVAGRTHEGQLLAREIRVMGYSIGRDVDDLDDDDLDDDDLDDDDLDDDDLDDDALDDDDLDDDDLDDDDLDDDDLDDDMDDDDLDDDDMDADDPDDDDYDDDDEDDDDIDDDDMDDDVDDDDDDDADDDDDDD